MRIDPCKGCGEMIDIASDHKVGCTAQASHRVSASMAEGMAALIRKAMLDHRVVWELDPDGETLVARCDSCAYLGSELETFEHQANIAAEQLAANGYGKLEDAKAAALEDAADARYKDGLFVFGWAARQKLRVRAATEREAAQIPENSGNPGQKLGQN